MKLILTWEENKEIKNFIKEFNEVLNQYNAKDMIIFEYNNTKIENQPSIDLIEESIWFSDNLIKWKLFNKNEIKELIEGVFWIEAAWGCSSGCNTCSSGC